MDTGTPAEMEVTLSGEEKGLCVPQPWRWLTGELSVHCGDNAGQATGISHQSEVMNEVCLDFRCSSSQTLQALFCSHRISPYLLNGPDPHPPWQVLLRIFPFELDVEKLWEVMATMGLTDKVGAHKSRFGSTIK